MKNATSLMKWALLLMAVSMAACERMVLDDGQQTPAGDQGNVVIRVSMYDIVPFSLRSVQNIADYSTNLCVVFYKDGEQTKRFTQKKGDEGYGQVSTNLAPGTYQVLALAHSCPGGNPVLTNPAALKFTNQTGYSDTFYWYGDLEVTTEANVYDIAMQRAASMVSVTITDEIPATVNRIRLYYDGESGVFDAVSGWGGTTNSKQYIIYNVDGATAPLTLNAYTFLRDETGSLNLVVTAYDAQDRTVAEKELVGVPMKNRMVTKYSGPLFSESLEGVSFSFTAETDWEVYGSFSF